MGSENLTQESSLEDWLPWLSEGQGEIHSPAEIRLLAVRATFAPRASEDQLRRFDDIRGNPTHSIRTKMREILKVVQEVTTPPRTTTSTE